MEQDNSFLQLPSGVITKIDVGRLIRELQALDEFLDQSEIRQAGESLKMPKTSKLLDDMMQLNKLSGLKEDDRNRLLNFLITMRAKAPVLHMSFSADPSPSFLLKLVAWLRENIHPLTIVQVGLQPNIGAGCIVRTTNKYFDMSLREDFSKKRDVLIQRLTVPVHEKTEQPKPVEVAQS